MTRRSLLLLLFFLPFFVVGTDFRPQGNVNLTSQYTITSWNITACSGSGLVKGIYANGSWNCASGSGVTADTCNPLTQASSYNSSGVFQCVSLGSGGGGAGSSNISNITTGNNYLIAGPSNSTTLNITANITALNNSFNESGKIAQVNTSSNIGVLGLLFGFNKTTDLQTYFTGLFLGINAQAADSLLFGGRNTSYFLNGSSRFSNVSGDVNVSGNGTNLVLIVDQKFNMTSQITSVNNSVNLINNNLSVVISNKSGLGNCAAGTVVQNLTSGSPQCVAVSAAASTGGNMSLFFVNVTNGTQTQVQNASQINLLNTSGIGISLKQDGANTNITFSQNLTSAQIVESGNLFFTDPRAAAANGVINSSKQANGDLTGTFTTLTVVPAAINTSKLNCTNSPGAGQFLSYASNGQCTWVSASAASGITSFNVTANGTNSVIQNASVIMFVNGNGTFANNTGGNISYSLTTTGVAGSTCGSATNSCVLIYDLNGRLVNATNVAITGSGGSGAATNAGFLNSTNTVFLANNATNVSVGNNSGTGPNLFVDETNNRVGIGTSTPTSMFNILSITSPAVFNLTGVTNGVEQMTFQGSATQLYSIGLRGTTSAFYITPGAVLTTNPAVIIDSTGNSQFFGTLNASAIKVGTTNVCLQDGTNCQAVAYQSSASGWTNNTNNITTNLNVTMNGSQTNISSANIYLSVKNCDVLNTSATGLLQCDTDASSGGTSSGGNMSVFYINSTNGTQVQVQNTTQINLLNNSGIGVLVTPSGSAVNLTFTQNLSTTQITEGVNLYYTDTRSALSVQNTTLLRNSSIFANASTSDINITGNSTSIVGILKNSGVTAGTYGNASAVGQAVVSAKGLITSMTNISIAIDAAQLVTGILAIARGGTGKTSWTNGSVVYYDGTTLNENNNQLYYNQTDGRICIGMNGDCTDSPGSRTLVFGDYDSYQQNDSGQYTNASYAGYSISTSRNTSKFPLASQNNDPIGGLKWYAYNGTDYPEVAAIRSNVFSNASNLSAFITFNVINNQTRTMKEAMRIANDGKIGINTPIPSQTWEVNGSVCFGDCASKGISVNLSEVSGKLFLNASLNTTNTIIFGATNSTPVFWNGTNPCAGVATLSGGTVTVTTSCMTSARHVMVVDEGSSVTNVGNLQVSTRGTGTFTVQSTNVLDASPFYWEIHASAGG